MTFRREESVLPNGGTRVYSLHHATVVLKVYAAALPSGLEGSTLVNDPFSVLLFGSCVPLRHYERGGAMLAAVGI